MKARQYQTCQLASEYTIWCLHHICGSVCYHIYYYSCTRQNKLDTYTIITCTRCIFGTWMMFASFRSLKSMKAPQYQTCQLASKCTIWYMHHICTCVFAILFITYHSQEKRNLTHKQQAHAQDEYLGHEWCLHHLDLSKARTHGNTKHAN